MINYKFIHFKCKRKKHGSLGGFDTVYLKGYFFPIIQWVAMGERDIFQVVKSSKKIQSVKMVISDSDVLASEPGLIIDGSEAERISKTEYQNATGDKSTHYMEYLQYAPSVVFFSLTVIPFFLACMGWI
jgi:hypothetical protein